MLRTLANRKLSTLRCDACGVYEVAELLDAKPSDGDWENGDYDRFECVNCYGPAYVLIDHSHIDLSIVPHWREAYLERVACEILAQHYHIVWC